MILALADVVKRGKSGGSSAWDENKVSLGTIEYLLTICGDVLKLLPILLARVFVETSMGQLIRLRIAANSGSFLALYPPSRKRDEPAIGLHCYLDDDIIVDLRVDALDGWSAIVDGHHPPPDLLLHADVMIQLTHVFNQLVIPAA